MQEWREPKDKDVQEADRWTKLKKIYNRSLTDRDTELEKCSQRSQRVDKNCFGS